MYNSMILGVVDSVDNTVLQHVEVVAGDIRDHSSVSAAVRDCDAVLRHLAALIAIPFSYHAPASYVDTNIKGHFKCLSGSE